MEDVVYYPPAETNGAYPQEYKDYNFVYVDILGRIKSLETTISELEKKINQFYFWSPEWQEGERAADRDIEAGRIKRTPNVKEALKYLRS